MIFWRIKPLEQILATAEKKSLKRQLGPIQLTLLGIGAVIGTGIFVLTAEAAQKAGPAMMLSFVIAAIVCGLAALSYAELAAMVPVSGSAYTYTYGVMGELIAWIVGWALVLEYAIGATAVCVGWAGYVNGLLADRAVPWWRFQPACIPDRRRRHLVAGDRNLQERARERGAGGDQDRRTDSLHRALVARGEDGQPASVPAQRLGQPHR